MDDVKKLEKLYREALSAVSGGKKGFYDGTEEGYRDQIFAYLSRNDIRDAYVEPVLAKLLKRASKQKVDYDIAMKAIKRAIGEVARNWKMTHVMTTGLSKAAIDRQIAAVARTVMEEIYLTRLGDARRAGKAV